MLPIVLLLAHSTSTVAAAALADWRIGAGDDGLIPCSALTLPVATDATADSQAAAAELAQWLGRITNSSVQVTQPAAIPAGVPHFAVGPAAAMAAPGITSAELVALGPESFVVRGSWGGVIALSGAPDANRGTQFAVLQLLHAIGVRFLAADATVVPSCCQHCVQATPRKLINISWVPAFNFRAVDGWASNHDPTHAMRSHLDVNPEAPFASPPGFVHTSYRLFPSETPPFNCSSYIRCPSESFFREHREWFWPHNDSSAYGQLCWHNQSLIKYLIGTVKGFLRDSRNMNATLIDVSQNDNGNYCKDPEELAIIAEEQSGVGPILRAVNAIADAIREEFPRVSVSTLAYDYGEQPPIKTQVRENVAIRLWQHELRATNHSRLQCAVPYDCGRLAAQSQRHAAEDLGLRCRQRKPAPDFPELPQFGTQYPVLGTAWRHTVIPRRARLGRSGRGSDRPWSWYRHGRAQRLRDVNDDVGSLRQCK